MLRTFELRRFDLGPLSKSFSVFHVVVLEYRFPLLEWLPALVLLGYRLVATVFLAASLCARLLQSITQWGNP